MVACFIRPLFFSPPALSAFFFFFPHFSDSISTQLWGGLRHVGQFQSWIALGSDSQISHHLAIIHLVQVKKKTTTTKEFNYSPYLHTHTHMLYYHYYYFILRLRTSQVCFLQVKVHNFHKSNLTVASLIVFLTSVSSFICLDFTLTLIFHLSVSPLASEHRCRFKLAPFFPHTFLR